MKEKFTRAIAFILAIVIMVGSINFTAVQAEAASKNVIFYVSWGDTASVQGPRLEKYSHTVKLSERWGQTGKKELGDLKFEKKYRGKYNEYILEFNNTYMGFEVDHITVKFRDGMVDKSNPGFGIRIHDKNSLSATSPESLDKGYTNVYYTCKTMRKSEWLKTEIDENNEVNIYPGDFDYF